MNRAVFGLSGDNFGLGQIRGGWGQSARDHRGTCDIATTTMSGSGADPRPPGPGERSPLRPCIVLKPLPVQQRWNTDRGPFSARRMGVWPATTPSGASAPAHPGPQATRMASQTSFFHTRCGSSESSAATPDQLFFCTFAACSASRREHRPLNIPRRPVAAPQARIILRRLR